MRIGDRRLRIGGLVAFVLALTLASGLGAQQQTPPTFRTGVTLVTATRTACLLGPGLAAEGPCATYRSCSASSRNASGTAPPRRITAGR